MPVSASPLRCISPTLTKLQYHNNYSFRQSRTSIARVRDKYNPTEKNAPIYWRESRIIGGIAGVVYVIDVTHFGRVYKRFVKESDSDDPSQLEMALNEKTFNIIFFQNKVIILTTSNFL